MLLFETEKLSNFFFKMEWKEEEIFWLLANFFEQIFPREVQSNEDYFINVDFKIIYKLMTTKYKDKLTKKLPK